MSNSARWTLAFFAVGFTVGCVVSLDPDQNQFTCDTDADCGGDGYVCVDPVSAAKRCCKPTGNETCNGLDDDCDGQIDEGLPAETCNGLDDDCDGQTDETFNLQTDDLNCGSCGNACPSTHRCDLGACKVRGELSCSDGVDNDMDSQVDCADTDCNLLTCGTGCTCKNFIKAETDCTNSVDDDLDGPVDCTDTDCNNVACGGGCLCSGGLRTETNCGDGLDNNGDGGTDCADISCRGFTCQTAPATFTCNNLGQCGCRDAGTSPPAENNFARCRNGIDDDCNGKTDCAEASCNGISCEFDGGAGCQCRDGGKVELNCADRVDNDGDFNTDCGEMLADGGGECPGGTACTYVMGMVRNGTCQWDVPTLRGVCRQ
jgi:Putative metal-binding motif